MKTISLFVVALALIFNPVFADEPNNPNRELDLAKYLTGKKFVGQFTVDGRDKPPSTEEYVISKCEKLPADDMYRLTARIKYGDVDSEVPMEIKILFAGETPVITLDSLWIPGMGTFDARVLIRRNRYAGSWQHDDKGGHLFGRILPADSIAEPE
ncbi:hypothetical protein Pla22_21960 [Rubripirellula amarantea]|uniref:Uncharacterized protein n=1 Tax=Rubripirellula amarantea TaxID=2527999 RepID=A0A5C5WVA5_9BACT|nr:hypothetical protein [Rubripirellula amarantea]TWT54548.1 hypothetical protein Pla22_21960 [Rubripirellula amarantea]